MGLIPIKSRSYISEWLCWHIHCVEYLPSSLLGLFLDAVVCLGLSPSICFDIYVVIGRLMIFMKRSNEIIAKAKKHWSCF